MLQNILDPHSTLNSWEIICIESVSPLQQQNCHKATNIFALPLGLVYSIIKAWIVVVWNEQLVGTMISFKRR